MQPHSPTPADISRANPDHPSDATTPSGHLVGDDPMVRFLATAILSGARKKVQGRSDRQRLSKP